MIQYTGNIIDTSQTSTQYNSQFMVAPYATTTYTVKAKNNEEKYTTCVVTVQQQATGISFSGPDSIKRTVYRDWETDRKSTRLNSSHSAKSRMPSSA